MAHYKAEYYKDFKQSLRAALTSLKSDTGSKLILCSGSCDFFVQKAQASIIKTLSQIDKHLLENVQSFEANEMSDEAFKESVYNSDLFSKGALVIIKRAEQRAGFSKLITETFKGSVDNYLIVCVGKSKQSASITKAIKKLDHLEIICDSPAKSEVPHVIRDLSKKAQLLLDSDCISYIEDNTGTDLFKIENEIEKLSLYFAGSEQQLSKKDIAPLLSTQKEDLAFILSNHLMENNYPKAVSFASELVERGESVIALIGLIASHCRKSLKIAAALKKSSNPKILSQMTDLQFFIIKRYTNYVRKSPETLFIDALINCQRLEGLAKSSRISHKLLLQSLIGGLIPQK